jgi:hypothetical protein
MYTQEKTHGELYGEAYVIGWQSIDDVNSA